jgi:hypothetical protein
MGAGQGKTRRAQAVASKPSERTVACEALYKAEVWAEFIRNAGIDGLRLQQYYLGHPLASSQQVSDQEYETILAGLFADAVTVGAIVLPDPYKIEDFQFKVGSHTRGRRVDAAVVRVDKPDSLGRLYNVDGLVGPSGLYVWAAAEAVERIAESITYALIG